VKWNILVIAVIILVLAVGGWFGVKALFRLFPGDTPDIIDTIDDSGGVDGDIADLGAGIEDIEAGVSDIEDRGGRIESGVDSLREHRENAARRVEGIEGGLEKVEAGLDISEGAKDQLADFIRRLQGTGKD